MSAVVHSEAEDMFYQCHIGWDIKKCVALTLTSLGSAMPLMVSFSDSRRGLERVTSSRSNGNVNDTNWKYTKRVWNQTVESEKSINYVKNMLDIFEDTSVDILNVWMKFNG